MFSGKEILRKNRWSLNALVSKKNAGMSVGYNINDYLKAHGIIVNSWKDTFSGKFRPKIGIGIGINFEF